MNPMRDAQEVARLFKKRTGVEYQNHIQAQAVEHKLKRSLEWKRAFVWLIFIPGCSIASWYGIYKLIQWMLYG
tara:strand:- start:612 stop:830 length:219 start_codon:yes stop_codon:yes gene_type:complete